jgi:hypothetical protein
LREEVCGDAGGGGRSLSAEEGVPGEREVEFIDGVHFRKRPDQAATAFAVEVSHWMVAGEGVEEIREALAVEGDGKAGRWSGAAGDEQVDRATWRFENRVVGRDVTGARNDAAEGLDGFSGHGEGHAVGYEGSATDEQGVGVFPEFEQAGVILA